MAVAGQAEPSWTTEGLDRLRRLLTEQGAIEGANHKIPQRDTHPRSYELLLRRHLRRGINTCLVFGFYTDQNNLARDSY